MGARRGQAKEQVALGGKESDRTRGGPIRVEAACSTLERSVGRSDIHGDDGKRGARWQAMAAKGGCATELPTSSGLGAGWTRGCGRAYR